ncbi:Carboxypeptidase S1 A like protein [Verticillium longisporum]|uniref:Carboxypeptidase S1 A like protein n=1 Tax=Verticillium longisporum TaxID=100787 RepID=A0A8I3AMG3_VERLO|nr:Carboxypeptidase S1 A like protein [Verticillium longisporum]
MRTFQLLLLSAGLSSVSTTSAQYAPTTANLTTVRSPFNHDITISYKSPDGACRSAFDHQKQYTGWVNVPGDYPTNLFFWFVEARQKSDILTIWLNGGPGSSSLFGMFNGVGPCEIIEAGLDQYDTLASEWGWDRASNMLFIDQPNQVGFSYDTPTNGTLNILNNTRTTPPRGPIDDLPPHLFLNGTFSSLNPANTPNTTEDAAMAVWHMLQGFLSVFPQYNPPKQAALGVNLFAESYGGKYGPVFSDVWERQNAKRLNNTIPRNSTLEIHLAALGIVNGCIDDEIQAPYYPSFAVNNTYGFEGINSVRANLANASFNANGGCRDLLRQCRTAQSVYDPASSGNVHSVNEICSQAYTTCYRSVIEPFSESGRSFYDISQPAREAFPSNIYIEYANTPAFQEAIGAVTNFSSYSLEVLSAFSRTGDNARGPLLPRLAALLDSGVRVGLVYGDRDYICNWRGGEAAANALAGQARAPYGQLFTEAGYAPIIVNDSYIGGVVRQYGNLSFSRVYQAGHAVPAFQPETAFQIFARIVMGTSLSTGDAVDLAAYATKGDAKADKHRDKLPAAPAPTCWLRAVPSTCSDDEVEMLRRGEGVVINGVLYASEGDWPLATRTTTSSVEAGAATSATQTLTGLFTATSTPRNGDVASRDPRGSMMAMVVAFSCTLVWVGTI